MVSKNINRKRTLLYLLISAIVILIVSQGLLYILAKLDRNLFQDEIGTTQLLVNKISQAQEEYKKKHDTYAKDSKSLNIGEFRDFYFAYANEVPTLLQSLCNDCMPQKDKFKMMLIRKDNKSIWSFDEKGALIHLK